jgi:hypothetical protein
MSEHDHVWVDRDLLWQWHDKAEWLRHVAQQDGHEYYAELAEELRQDIDEVLLHGTSKRQPRLTHE